MSRTEPPEVVVLGASCLDLKVRPLAPIVPGTSNPAQIRLSPGGAARNMAENLARLGVRVALLSVVGTDPVGQSLMERTARAGVDVSRVIRTPHQHTGSYLALFSGDDHQGFTLDDVSQIKQATPEYVQSHRQLFKHAKMVMMDGNLDTETIAAALAITGERDVPVCIDPVSVRRSYALRPYLSEFTLVTPNVPEAEALLDMSIGNAEGALEAARKMVSSGVGVAIITLAEEGLVYGTSQGLGEGYGRIPAIRANVVDWIGAGDALTAAVAYGMMNGMPVDECMWLGVAAATLTLESSESVNPVMSLEQLYANMVI